MTATFKIHKKGKQLCIKPLGFLFVCVLIQYFISAFEGSMINYWLSDRNFASQI